MRPSCVSRLLVDKISILLSTEQTVIHQVLAAPSGVADPSLWKSSHCMAPINLVALQCISQLSRGAGGFHLCQLWSVSSLLLWPQLPLPPLSLSPPGTSLHVCQFYVLTFFFLHCSPWAHLFPWTAFSSSLLWFLPPDFYPVRSSCLLFPVCE